MIEVLGIMVICILFEAFNSGSEIAIVSVNREQLKYLVEKGSVKAKALSRVLENPERILSTTLLGTNLATTSLNAVATLYVIRTFGDDYEFATVFFTAPMVLIFAEVIPKAFFQRFADRIAPNVVYPLRLLSWLFIPLTWSVSEIARLSARMANVEGRRNSPLVTREELEMMFDTSKRSRGVKDLERMMIDRIFDFSEQLAREVMIPLSNVVSVRHDSSIRSAMRVMRESGYSRLPIYAGRVFNHVGWVSQFDLLFAENVHAPVSEVMRKIRYVPANTELDTLLLQLQRNHDSLASVIDEFGGAIGLITLEDVIEEIVGDIEDEFDEGHKLYERLDGNRIRAHGRMPVHQLNEIIPRPLPEDGDYETLGGLLMTLKQRVPKVGEEIRYRKLLFIVLEATDRTVEEVEILHP